jgi:hypothetical protein
MEHEKDKNVWFAKARELYEELGGVIDKTGPMKDWKPKRGSHKKVRDEIEARNTLR